MPRADGSPRRGNARLRPVGHPAAGRRVIPFERGDDRVIRASLTRPEATLIASLAGQIAALLGGLVEVPHFDDPDAAALFESVGMGGTSTLNDDPAIARLLPNAYAEPGASGDFRRLTERSLASRKVANAGVVVASLDAALNSGGELALDDAEAQSWLRTLADIRLTIAARLGIEADGDEGADDDDSLALRDVYDWLAWVTDSLIGAIEE
ncbi:DUF2017 family protein [Glaciihabitans arcticus]|uniref:DUF2017 family protein n=1 Tax=Glaciihabitans arcticus TaxID=2668039 RepID=A0A4Q9H1F7_9MICO|nr:DUF2017 family protein [Glaciihabitans arcticus]